MFWSENLTGTVVRNRRLTETKNLFTLIYYFRVGQIFLGLMKIGRHELTLKTLPHNLLCRAGKILSWNDCLENGTKWRPFLPTDPVA